MNQLARRHFVAALLAALPAVALAGWINKAGEALSDAENRKAVGEFGAQLVLVADDRHMFKVWGTPSKTVNISTIDTVFVNGQVNAFVVFSGCKPSKAGYCNVAVRFRVYQPNGKVYADTPSMEVWQGKPPPPGKTLDVKFR